MGAEHSHQHSNGHEIFSENVHLVESSSIKYSPPNSATLLANTNRRGMVHQNTNNVTSKNTSNKIKQSIDMGSSPLSEHSRASSPPLSVCSDLPYISYTDRPIGGDSPKLRNKPHSLLQVNSSRLSSSRNSYPIGSKPKRPQSTASNHSIVIVKPGARDSDFELDLELLALQNIPNFLPVLQESITSAIIKNDSEIRERLHSKHLVNICNRMQLHMNISSTQIANEQNQLVERTKIVSNSITTLFASFVDMQKTYSSYSEQFTKILLISQQLRQCNEVLKENITSLEYVNNFLYDVGFEPFIWRSDDNEIRDVLNKDYCIKHSL